MFRERGEPWVVKPTSVPVPSPCAMLRLPLGQTLRVTCVCVLLLVLKDKGYTTLQDEAIKIFNSLQQLESMSDPIPIIQGILQTGHDLRPLRDELYCQLIKQTNKVPHPGSVGNLCSWQILTCLSCTFLPSRGILKYLRFHLRRWGVQGGGGGGEAGLHTAGAGRSSDEESPKQKPPGVVRDL